MNRYTKMILFVVILGTITSLLLGGMESFTYERIEANKEAELKSAVLNGHSEDFTMNNIHDVFADTFDVYELDGLTFYVHKTTNNISYHFDGGGVWGPIVGIITISSDFETIMEISILEQEETPGLGGVVAERNYLDTFVGKKLVPNIDILKEDSRDNNDNQVDAITGATRTSDAFEIILNTSYADHKTAWDNQ